MRLVPLSDLADKVDYGVTASATDERIGPQFLRITDIQNGAVDWNRVPFCDAPAAILKRSQLRVGDIVFARTGATTGKSFLIRSCPENAVFASYLIRVRPSEQVDAHYLAHFFDSADYWRQIETKAVGAAQPGVNASKLGELLVPLPPSPDQKRIAAILDQAGDLRRKRSTVGRGLERLRESLLDAACSQSERERPLSSLFVDIKMGPFGSLLHKADYVMNGVPLVNPMHIAQGRIFPDPNFAVSQSKADELRSYQLVEDDVVIGRRGEMGRSALVLKEHSGMLCGTGSMRLRVDRTLALPEFVADFMSHPRQVRELENAASGVTMLNLSSATFAKIITKYPTLDAQARYVKLKAALKLKRDLFETGTKQMDALFASLQHRAFRGEL